MMHLDVSKKELLVKLGYCLKIKCKLPYQCKKVIDVISMHGAVQSKVLS